MIIETLKVNGLRNIIKGDFYFSPKKNLIHGMNGSGKTSVLEAVFLLGFGKSFLNVKCSDLVNYGEKGFFLGISIHSQNCENQIRAVFNNRLSLYLDEKKSGIFEINKYLYPVFFSSSNYNLNIENKPYTRKMMDRFIFGVDSLYIRYILSYNKALKQKNHLLKTRGNVSEVSSWNKIISEASEKIVSKKMAFIDRLNKEIENRFDCRLRINYGPSFNTGNGVSKDEFYSELEGLRDREVKYARSLKGPHLDEFDIELEEKNLRFYSSGEKKINLLKIYISFIELYHGVKQDYPVFLVDDYDVAMDKRNIDFLIDNYPDIQVIATSVNKHEGFDRFIELRKENRNSG